MFMYLAICAAHACHLPIFISEEISLFEDAFELSVIQTAVSHWNIV